MQHAYLYANLVYTVNESFSAATIIVAKGVQSIDYIASEFILKSLAYIQIVLGASINYSFKNVNPDGSYGFWIGL